MPNGTRHGHRGNYFAPANTSAYLLGLPKSRPRLRNWCVFAILTGTILALVVLMLGNLIF